MIAGARIRATREGRVARAAACVLLAAAALTPGCYTAQMTTLQSSLDSLRTQVEELNARDSVSMQTLEGTRRELTEQREQLFATRATASSTAREMEETLSRLEGKLDDIMARFRIQSERAPARPSEPPAGGGTPSGTTAGSPGGAGATQLYDQATQDLTQGRYPLALTAYRDFLKRFPDSDLADNAQYGVGESFFAQARFDSALTEYSRVGSRWPEGDRAPAALYKRGLCEDRLGRAADAKGTFEELIKKFPQSGEAQLARDRLARR